MENDEYLDIEFFLARKDISYEVPKWLNIFSVIRPPSFPQSNPAPFTLSLSRHRSTERPRRGRAGSIHK